ncbi:MAG: FkbM family methyltransferase [Bacteroidales bacterium]|nr:FkbM family methyltransferase [Bacteroidales bacterium]
MRKINIYYNYITEFLRYRDFISIIASVNYLFTKKSHSKDRVVNTGIGKFYCRKNTNDFLFANFAYEKSVKRFIFKNLKKFDIFFDGGACIGDYSILMAKSGLKCFAFEPVSDSYRVLSRNIQLNDAGALIQSFPFGLSNDNHSVFFVFNPVNTGDSHIDRHGGSGNCEVEVKTLDSVFKAFNLNSSNRVLFKLDVEGMEMEALQGAKEFISFFDNITFIVESAHTPVSLIKETLDRYASFDYGTVDEYNMFAIKKSAHSGEIPVV